MNTYFCQIEMKPKNKTAFFTDVKTDIKAGMEYREGKILTAKMRKVGTQKTRIYFDTAQKDCIVGHERLQRTIKH